MVLSGSTLIKMWKEGNPIVVPFLPSKHVFRGMSYGCSVAGYDVTIAQDVKLTPLNKFQLASTEQRFIMPNNIIGFVYDKSSLARQGLSLFNTVIEPGWTGYLTLELGYLGMEELHLTQGSPIAQIIFMYTDAETEGYKGKYQNQKEGPVGFVYENN